MKSSAPKTDEDPDKPVIRIDGAHKMQTVTANHVAPEIPAAARSLAATTAMAIDDEPHRLQASQLARHLQDRRREVDHRESQLNARIAQLENDLRLSRLWLREQSQEFSQRESQLQHELEEQAARLRVLAAAEAEMEATQKAWSDAVTAREAALECREHLATEAHARIEAETNQLQLERQRLADERRHFDAALESNSGRSRLDELETLERQLQAHHEELDRDHQRQAEALQIQREELATRQVELAAHQQRVNEDLERKQGQLVGERNRQEQRQATMERLRGEVFRLHREALEMRLIAEQLWGQMAGRVAPAELTAGLRKLRSQLADEFRLANQELADRKSSLQELLAKLDEKQQALAAQRTELMAWLARRQRELGHQAESLAEREQQLARDKELRREERNAWEIEHRQLLRQVRQLQAAQLRRGELAAV